MATFPYADMPLVIEARFGGLSWTDLSSRRTDEPINVRAWRSPGAQRSDAGSASIVLDNDDGALTPLNPVSGYWPYVDTGLEMRFRQRWASDTFTRSLTDSLGSTDDGLAWTTAGGVAANFDVNGTAATVAYTTTSTRSAIVTPPFAVGDAAATMSWSALATGTGGYASHVGVGSDATHLYAARMVWSTAGGIQFEIGRIDGGGFYNIGGGVDLTHTYTADQHWATRIQVAAGGLVLGKLWQGDLADEPTEWTLTGIDTTVADWGLAELTDLSKAGFVGYLQAGNTNASPVLSVHEFQANYDVFHGEAGDINPDFIPNTDGDPMSVVRITLGGVSRRYTQGSKPEKSAPRRWLEGLAAPDVVPVAAWTLEEGRLVSGGEPTFGGEIMRPFVGTHPSGALVSFPQWGAGDLAPWLPSVVSRAGSATTTIMWAPVSMPGFTNAWTIDIAYASGSDAAISFIDVNPQYLGGATGWPQMAFDPANGAVSVVFGTTPETTNSARELFDGLVHAVRFIYRQNGGNVEIFTYVDGNLIGGGGAVYAGTLTAITRIAHGSEAGSGALAVGYLTVWADLVLTSDYSDAIAGHPGELAHERAGRIAGEESAPIVVAGGRSPQMGPQRPGTLFDILGQCEDVAQGVFAEAGASLAFTALSARYNVAAAVTVNLATYRTESSNTRQVLAPQFSDRGRVNQYTATRPDGGSATYPDTAPTPLYDDGGEFHVEQDDQLLHVARYKVHRGQQIAMRHPGTPLNLGENSNLIAGWMRVTRFPGLGRIVRTGVPTKYGPVDIDETVDGYTQTLKPRSWTVTYDGTPTALLTAPTYSDTAVRYGSRSTVTEEALDTTETGIDVASTGPRWVTGSAVPQFPFDVDIEGEQIRLSSIASAILDAFGRTSSSGWTTADSGQAWTNAGGSPTDHTVSGGTGRLSISARNTAFSATLAASYLTWDQYGAVTFPATPTGADAEIGVRVRYVDGSNFVDMRLFLLTTGAVQLVVRQVKAGVETIGTFTTVAGLTATTALRWRVQAIGSVLRAKVWAASGSEPKQWHDRITTDFATAGALQVYAQVPTSNTNVLPLVVTWDNVEAVTPQRMTGTRSINGVVRSHNNGVAVTLHTAAVYAY